MMPLLPALALLLALASDGLTAFQGRVLDSTGKAVEGAVLEVRHPGQEPVLARVTTNLDGGFLIRLADDGEQVVITVTCDGFAAMTLGPTDLSSSTRMDITLHRRSELEETVQVEGTGVTVPLDENPAATSFSEMAVEALPLVGRTITDVLVLAPGITETDDGRIHVRGARDTGLQLRLDGSNVTNPLTGQFGQEVNLETVQEVQVVTSGAPAEYGRADGGFAEVITKSGGNDVSGSLKLYYRSSFIDGDGANGDREGAPSFDDTSLYGTLGGPLVRDRLWYFGSVQRIRKETPVTLADGPFIVTSARGTSSFLKTTWQADTLNKLSAQVNADPLETLGNHIGPTIAADSDYRLETGGPLYQVNWTSVLSPDLLMTALISALDTGRDIEPVSSDFSPREIERLPLGNQFAVPLPCLTRNCQGDTDLHRFFREDTFGTRASRGPLREAGPYNIRSDQTLRRITLRTDVSYVKESSSGQHSLKSGFEANDEEYLEEAVHNPTLTDRSCEFLDCNIAAFPAPPLGTRYGRLLLEVHDPAERLMRADGLNLGFYLQDAWRIRPNLLLHVGVRADLEEDDRPVAIRCPGRIARVPSPLRPRVRGLRQYLHERPDARTP
jgi:outer membrane receptor protein involved in Fe transport